MKNESNPDYVLISIVVIIFGAICFLYFKNNEAAQAYYDKEINEIKIKNGTVTDFEKYLLKKMVEEKYGRVFDISLYN